MQGRDTLAHGAHEHLGGSGRLANSLSHDCLQCGELTLEMTRDC